MYKAKFVFEYALKSPCGKFYTGRSGDGWLGSKNEAFTYTQAGAANKVAHYQFSNFVVERIL